jgi:hypothetical protein
MNKMLHKMLWLPWAMLIILFSVVAYLAGNVMGYNDALKSVANDVSNVEKTINDDCFAKNGFILNDVTFSCQPIMPIPQYAK